MILLSIETEQDLKIFVWSFIIMFAYLAYEPAYAFVTGTGGSQQMYGTVYVADKGILAGHVALANNMNQMIPIAFFLIFSLKKKIYKIIASATLCIFILALIGSGSRGGVVGLMFFCALVVYFSEHRARNAVITGIVVIILFAYSVTIKSTGSRIDSGATKGRLIGLVHGIEMVRVKGHILGVGPGCFMLARGRYFGYTMESHNIYGQVIGDLGIPGTIVWILLIRQIFLNIVASKKRLKALSLEHHFLYKLSIGIQTSLLVRLFVSLASHGLYYFYWYVMAALSIAVLKIAENMPDNLDRNESQI
jgi:O-antigen ligase